MRLLQVGIAETREGKDREGPKQREGGCLIGLALSAVIAVCDSFAISLPSTLRSRLRIGRGRPRLFPCLPLVPCEFREIFPFGQANCASQFRFHRSSPSRL